uniref:(California timema) hypothetical protein n=1 Tax=Timema californicum TaxID=61474 RepID=A0A7R9J1L8_TIMCA|nr:unnamed protein product [Timema californicum]
MLPIPDPNKPEQHEPWCPLSVISLWSKGRTNIELREQFILADGVSQSMTAFKPRTSLGGTQQRSQSVTAAGPITKEHKIHCWGLVRCPSPVLKEKRVKHRLDHGSLARAEEFLSQLMPIFESLRQKEELPYSYPLAMGSGSHTPSYHWVNTNTDGPGVVVVTMDERQQLVPLTLVSRVRERSVRSVPMSSRTNTTTSRSSFSGGTRTPDSLSDNESSLTRPLRKGSAPVRSTFTPGGSLPGSKAGSRPNSRPASRQGSKPPSRHGSTLSLDSTDEGTPSRIPVHQRRVTPASSTLPRSNASSSARKLTVPVNGTPGSRPRTPTGSGLISPASGLASRNYIQGGSRKTEPPPPLVDTSSFYHELNKTGTTLHRCHWEPLPAPPALFNETRTPSGSSTPIPPGAKVTRKPSGASDTSTGVSRKGSKSTTPTETRAPFRL